MIRTSKSIDIYRRKPAAEVPMYSVSDSAHYLGLPRSTVRAWVVGQRRFKPVVEIADPRGVSLSFSNLVEIYALSSLLRHHGVRLPAVRKAIRYMQRSLNSAHPLATRRFLTDGHSLFIEQYGKLIDASKHGQLAMKAVLAQYLKRIQYDSSGLPIRLFPLTAATPENSGRAVSIDPRVLYGQPCIAGTRIPTSIIAERFEAGDTITELVEDYGCTQAQIEESLRYEFPGRAA